MTTPTQQHWLVCCDIHNARQRQKANRLLRQFSLDYQKSGLETLLAGDIRGTLVMLHPCISSSDSLLLLPLLQQQPQPDWRLGKQDGEANHDTLVWA